MVLDIQHVSLPHLMIEGALLCLLAYVIASMGHRSCSEIRTSLLNVIPQLCPQMNARRVNEPNVSEKLVLPKTDLVLQSLQSCIGMTLPDRNNVSTRKNKSS